MHQDTAAMLDALRWQIELGATECISDTPISRFETAPQPPAPTAEVEPVLVRKEPPSKKTPSVDPGIQSARSIAASASSLDELRAALEGFDGCALRRGARSTVFADGNPIARLMIVGEAPGADEDRIGRPFVGRSGQLLDRMLEAIGHDRSSDDPATATYITNVLPWRPPQNRDPSGDEIAMMGAFLSRHIALAEPEFLLIMGRTAATTLLGTTQGITRLRGTWGKVGKIPAMPTFHPAALLRNPIQKRAVWQDLLSLKARMENPSQ